MTYTPKKMLRAMIEIPQPKTFLRSMLVSGPSQLSTTKHIELDKYVGKQGIAAYNSRTGAPIEVGKTGFTTDLHVSPYINEVITMTPSDFDTRQPGETVYDANPRSNLATRTSLYLKELINRCVRLEELQIAEAIQKGTVTVQNTAAGVDYTVDFGLDSDNKITLSGADDWDESTATIRSDIQAWCKRLADKGYSATKAFMDQKAANLLLDDTDVAARLDNRDILSGQIVFEEIAEMDATFLGTYRDAGVNLRLYSYQGSYETAADTFSNYIDDYRFVLVGQRVEVEQHYGKIENFNAGFRGKRFPNMWSENSGKVRYIGMESAPLAVLRNPNAILSAIVKSS